MYGLKYTINYIRRSNNETNIKIYQRDYVGDSTALIADADCLKLNVSKKTPFEPTIGIGAEINVIVNSLDLQDLYTTDEQEFEVYIYNNSETAPIYKGYLSTEIFNQDYSTNTNIPMTLQVNDGMKVLESIYYTPTADLTGLTLTKVSTVINNILSKLSHTYIRLYTNDTYEVFIDFGLPVHLFWNLTVNERNYLNESNEWMTCREVLDGILQPLGLNMYFRGNDIYLIDMLNLPTAQGNVYAVNGFTYIEATSIGGAVDLSGTTVNYYLTGQNIDIEPQKKQATIVYSQYNRDEINYDFSNKINWDTEGEFNLVSTIFTLRDYYYNSGVTYNNWMIDITNGTYGYMRATYDASEDIDSAEYYLSMYKTPAYDGAITVFRYTEPTEIMCGENYIMKIGFDVFANVGEQMGNDQIDIYHGATTYELKTLHLGIVVKLGNMYYDGTTWGWTRTVLPMIVKKLDDKQVVTDFANVFTPSNNVRVDMSEAPAGHLTIEITDYLYIPPLYGNYGSIATVLFKNMNVTFVDKNSSIEKEDIKTIGTLDSTASSDFPTINTVHGNSEFGISKAGFRYTSTGTMITDGFSNDGGTTFLPIEKILIQNIISQYKYPRYKINANLTTDVQLTTLDILYDKKMVSDNRNLPNISFAAMNATYYDGEENVETELLEITKLKEALSGETPTPTPTPPAYATVMITNLNGAYNITNVSVNGYSVSNADYPVTAGNQTAGTTTQLGASYSVVVTISSASTGEHIEITTQDCTTTASQNSVTFTGINTISGISIEYGSSAC